MNKLTKITLLAMLISLALPMKQFAQSPVRHSSAEGEANTTQTVQIREYENGFLFNVFEIENVEERVQLASALATSDIWICNPTHNPGELFIRPNSYNSDIPIYAEFDYLMMTLREEYLAASSLPKDEYSEIFQSWARNISHEYFNFLISDNLDRANHCMDAEPFCTTNVYNFPALNSGYSWSGPNYGCLGSSPTNKHSFWYYMRIGVAGDITIKIEASFDVDFALWGPFSDQTTPCPTEAGQAGLLTADCTSCPNNTTNATFYPSGNLHDCSFDARHYEYAHVVNGQVGQYYILLITNYSGTDGEITFQKYAGDGETDCSILPPMVNNDGPYCLGETINLTAVGQTGATYSWTGPNGFTSTEQNPSIPNCTQAMSGTYTCTITVGGQTNSATTSLIVLSLPTASFTATTVCAGNPTEFHSTATVTGQHFAGYQWNFGDGQTGEGEDVSHTYAEPGQYRVLHTVTTSNGCAGSVSETITVVEAPVAEFTATTVCQGETTHFTSTSVGEQISGYQWNFGDGETGTGETANHTYTEAGTYQVTLTTEGSGGTCSDEATHTVTVYATPAPVATASPVSVQYAESSTITVNPGAEGTFTYHWEPADMVTDPDSQTTQTVSLTESQIYTVIVTNTQGGCTTTAIVAVSMDGSNMTATATADQYELCEGDNTTLHAIPLAGTGNYSYTWSPANTLSSATSQNPVASPGVGTTTYSCHVTDGIVDADVSVNITVHPNEASEIHQTICEGTSYNFFGQNVSAAGEYRHTLETQHGCDSIVTLFLGINDHDESNFTVGDDENCDEYFWDPRGHEIIQTDHADLTYTQSGTYHRTYKNIADCDSIVTMHVQFEYTPHPTPIYPVDEENPAPHWVVTATEYQINTYDFHLWDTNPYCRWDTVTWTCEGAPDWIIEPFGDRAQNCKVYVLNAVADTVWLKAYAFNRCAPANGIMQKYWLVCSFYDVEEQAAADISVVPNPNNGQMTINFEQLSGKVNVSVYDMLGNLIDRFETHSGNGTGSVTYDMSRCANGIYHFVVTGKEGTVTKKVIIQH